jgi:Uncharacterised protein family (UPF0175)
MNLTLRIPDALAARFASADEMQRRAIEALALDEFRLGHLTRPELKSLLGFATRGELDAFLVAHGVMGSYTENDLDQDRADLQRLGL